MKRTAILLLVLLLFPLLAGCVSSPEAESAGIPLHACTLSATGTSPVKAQCGTLAVPEDPSNPDGRQIELNIAIIPAVSRDPAPDPIFMLAGGPGQAATEAFLPLLPSAERLHFKRELVLVDQRGTGQSNPLTCPEPTADPEIIGAEMPVEDQVAELAACRAALDTDPALYSTEIAMGDLDQVREALGYEQINLLGVSYGTRAALTYLRLYPDHVRSLVLDGVVPSGWALGESLGPDAQRSLDLTFARCAEDADCSARFPDLPGTFDTVLAKLEEAPVEVVVPDPITAAPVRVLMTPLTVAATIRLMSYSDIYTALIPLAIDYAGQGDFQMLASQYLILTGSLEESLGMGMYFSVLCAEDIPLLPQTPPGGDTDYFFDPQFEVLRAGCKEWVNHSTAPEQEEGILKSDTPTLLISGEADPVTPPSNAERVAELLSNNAHIIAPGLGHNNFYVGCIPNLVQDFIETASPTGLDTACVKTIRPMPFFLSPTGPEPR